MLEGQLRNEECTQLLQRIRVRFPETAAGSSLPPVILVPRGQREKIRKSRIRKFCTSYILCRASLFKKQSIIYTFPGQKWVVGRSYPKVGQSQQEDNQTCCTRGTQGISRTLHTKHTVALELITRRSTLWEELGSLDLKTQLPQGPGPKPLLAQPSIFLVQKRNFVPFPCSRPQGKSRLISQLNYQQIPKEDVPLLGHFWDISWLAYSLCFPKTHPNKS